MDVFTRLNSLSRIDINYYYSRVLQELACRTGGSFSRPTNVILLMTNHCNARCVHCKSYDVPTPEHEMTTDEWKRTLSELKQWLGSVYVYFTGGEALLRQDAIEIVEYATSLGLQVEFLSNGFPITEARAKRLMGCGIKRITVSLDGATAEIHDATRGRKNFFDRTFKALKLLVSQRDAINSETEIHAKTTIMSLNINSLDKVAELAADIGLNGVTYQALEPAYYSDQLQDEKWYENNPLWITSTEMVDESIAKLKKLKTAGYPISNTFENLDLIRNYFRNPEDENGKMHSHDYSKKKNECRAWVGGLQIMPDGGMKMCHWMEPYANARDGNLKSAWMNRAQCWKSDCGFI